MATVAMRSSPLTSLFDRWSHPSYEIRVRGTPIFLWGSAGITQNFSQPLTLHIRNDLFGQQISLTTCVASGAQTAIGKLQPGECVSIPLQGLSGVSANCAQYESVVACLIRE
jgi:hypothetical protein